MGTRSVGRTCLESLSLLRRILAIKFPMTIGRKAETTNATTYVCVIRLTHLARQCGPLGNGLVRPPAPLTVTSGQGVLFFTSRNLPARISLGQQTRGDCFEFQQRCAGCPSGFHTGARPVARISAHFQQCSPSSKRGKNAHASSGTGRPKGRDASSTLAGERLQQQILKLSGVEGHAQQDERSGTALYTSQRVPDQLKAPTAGIKPGLSFDSFQHSLMASRQVVRVGCQGDAPNRGTSQ